MCDPTKTEGAFKEFDRDGNGQLNPDEAFAAIQKRMPPPPPPQQPQPTGSCDEAFMKYDANRDKRVTWDEFYRPAPDMDPAAKDRYNEKFKSLDRNQDGALDPAEYCGNAVPPTAQPDPMPAPDCESRVKAYDPDADGTISFNDYADARYAELRFVKAPTDDEIRKLKEGFLVDAKKLDVNADGVLSYAEVGIDCKQ
jgi:Ca2+-binding EF-hand superfamily protein